MRAFAERAPGKAAGSDQPGRRLLVLADNGNHGKVLTSVAKIGKTATHNKVFTLTFTARPSGPSKPGVGFRAGLDRDRPGPGRR